MDKHPTVVKLCLDFAAAMKAGSLDKAMEIARKGEAEYPDAVLPQDSTWKGLIKLVVNTVEEAKKEAESTPAPEVQQVDDSSPAAQTVQEADESLPPAAGPFTVFGSDGEAFGEDSDLEACKEVAAELGDGAVVRDSNGALLWPLPQPEPEAEPRKESMREKLARLKAEKARQVEAAQPAAAPEPQVRKLTITHDAQDGTVLRGTAKGDGANEVVKPLGWRFFQDRQPGVPAIWYVPQSKGFRSRDDKIAEAESALGAAGFVVTVEVSNVDPATGKELPVKLTAEQRAAQRAAERAERAEQARQAAELAAAARQSAVPEATMPGLELFAAAAAALAQSSPPVPSAPVPAAALVGAAAPAAPAAPAARKAGTVRTRRSAKPSLGLEGLASLPEAMWWRMTVKKGVSAKDTATLVRKALKTVTEAHEAENEEDIKIEVRLHRDSRTLLIGAVLPERESAAVDTKLFDVQVPAIASLMVPGVGTMVERHSDFS